VSKFKRTLSKLWKLIPEALRWRVMWTVSPRRIVGVSGIVLNGRGEVLLAHHVYRAENAWGFPGGIVNYGEELAAAVSREVLEETGLQVEVGPLLQVGLGERWPHVSFQFLCTVEGTPLPQVGGELFEAGFYPPDALPCTLRPEQEGALAYALELYRQPERVAVARIVETE
jgi:8-oxo-dGTP diphosphatase